MICPLCSSEETKLYYEGKDRPFHRCGTCALIFVPCDWHLIPSLEKERYDLHHNDPSDEAYRAFLATLVDPLCERLETGARGIDYGAGPGPALSAMFGERGFSCINYDPFYADDRAALFDHYDFIASTETAEHFCHPRQEWERMVKMVKNGGWIGVMTQMRDESKDFAAWHYKDDPTHVSFYSPQTFEWIAGHFGMSVEIIGASVAIFRK